VTEALEAHCRVSESLVVQPSLASAPALQPGPALQKIAFHHQPPYLLVQLGELAFAELVGPAQMAGKILGVASISALFQA